MRIPFFLCFSVFPHILMYHENMVIARLFREENIHRAFVVILILKACNALLEIIGGILFLFSGAISSIILFLTNIELIEDPTDFLANYAQHVLPYFSLHAQLFGAFYLLSHGVVKIFLVVAILRGKLWAYPATMLFLGLLIFYQLYQFTYTHSTFLLLLTIFDMVLVFLTWHEYQFTKKHFAKRHSS
jgi:uncharacterized membrane protein